MSLISLKKIREQPWIFAALAVIFVFIILRVWRLNLPGETVFDEVYFPKMASQYLSGEKFFDIHPPLGKLIIALGELVFGNTTVGWRTMSLLAGLAFLPVTYWAVRETFNDRRAGMIAALLIAIDGLFIVYSRTGLMDGFMILFGLLAVGFAWQFRRFRLAGKAAWRQLFLTGLFAGLSVAVKWIGAGFLPLVAGVTFLAIFYNKKRPITFKDFFYWVLAMVALPLAIYTIPFLANWQTNFWQEFFTWHQQSWGYNVHLDATHPYSSKWWSWPFLIRPIWFYFKNDAGNVIGVDGIGNPTVWWGSTLAIVYTLMVLVYSFLVRKRPSSQLISLPDLWPILYLTAGWAIFYLPWVKVGRVLFLYHYFVSYLFALLLTSYWLSQTFSSPRSRRVTLGVLALAVITGIAFAPIWIAYPIPQAWFDRLMWFRSWI